MTILIATFLAAAQSQTTPPDYVQKNIEKAFHDPKTWERSAKADVLLTKHRITTKPAAPDKKAK